MVHFYGQFATGCSSPESLVRFFWQFTTALSSLSHRVTQRRDSTAIYKFTLKHSSLAALVHS